MSHARPVAALCGRATTPPPLPPAAPAAAPAAMPPPLPPAAPAAAPTAMPSPAGGTLRCRGHEERVNALATLPNGQFISVSEDSGVKLHDRDSNLRKRFPFRHDKQEVVGVAVLGGTVVVTAGNCDADQEGILVVWNVATGDVYRRRYLGDSVTALARVDHDRYAVALKSKQPYVQLWDHPSGPKALPAHTLKDVASEAVSALAVDARGRLYIASLEGTVSVFDVRDRKVQPRFIVTHCELNEHILCVSTGPRWAVASDSCGGVGVYSIETNRFHANISSPRLHEHKSVRALVVIGDCLLSAGSDRRLVCSKLPTGDIVAKFPERLHVLPTAITFLPPNRVALGFTNGDLHIIPLPSLVLPPPEAAPPAAAADISRLDARDRFTIASPAARGDGGFKSRGRGGFNSRGGGFNPRGRGYGRRKKKPGEFRVSKQAKNAQERREQLDREKAVAVQRKENDANAAAKKAAVEERASKADLVAGDGIEVPRGHTQASRARGSLAQTSAADSADAGPAGATTASAAATFAASIAGCDALVAEVAPAMMDAAKKAAVGPVAALAGPAAPPEMSGMTASTTASAVAAVPSHAPQPPPPHGYAYKQDGDPSQRPSHAQPCLPPQEQPRRLLEAPPPSVPLGSCQQPAGKQADYHGAVAGSENEPSTPLSNGCSAQMGVASGMQLGMQHGLPHEAVGHTTSGHLATGGQAHVNISRKRVTEHALNRGNSAQESADGSQNFRRNGTVALFGTQAAGPVVPYQASASANAVQSAGGAADTRGIPDLEALQRLPLSREMLRGLRAHELAKTIAASLIGHDPLLVEAYNANLGSVYAFLQEEDLTGECLAVAKDPDLDEFRKLLSAHLRKEGLAKVGNKIRLKRFIEKIKRSPSLGRSAS